MMGDGKALLQRGGDTSILLVPRTPNFVPEDGDEFVGRQGLIATSHRSDRTASQSGSATAKNSSHGIRPHSSGPTTTRATSIPSVATRRATATAKWAKQSSGQSSHAARRRST